MLLVLIVTVLSVAYFWFLRSDFGVLIEGARPEQAAAIVDELKKEDVSFQLRDGGRTILVSSTELDAARLNVSSNALPPKGTVGFELFNESDMGITDFAQKVNYQRALQGEIARTIMAMDGIAYARVHLALPERALFRTTRSQPRAAVTLTPQPGIVIDPNRIAGIQRLVAATVPDLAIDQVAVLNERGQLLTPEYTDVGDAAGGTAASALEYNYSQRAARAIAAAAPNAQLDLKITTVQRTGSSEANGYGLASGETVRRDHSVRLVLFSRGPLSSSEQEAIRRAVMAELSLDVSAGDQLLFSPAPQMAPPIPESTAVAPKQSIEEDTQSQFMATLDRNWSIAAFVLLLMFLLIWGARARRLRGARRHQLAHRIREQLLITQRSADAA